MQWSLADTHCLVVSCPERPPVPRIYTRSYFISVALSSTAILCVLSTHAAWLKPQYFTFLCQHSATHNHHLTTEKQNYLEYLIIVCAIGRVLNKQSLDTPTCRMDDL